MTRRRLPHVYVPGAALFVTWHLHGSLPASVMPPPGAAGAGEAFVWIDRQLDAAGNGPTYLRRTEIAEVVVRSIHKGVELGHYELGAYVVMANHVHLLIRPLIAPDRIMQSLKGSTARKANRLLGRSGEPFWQKESYDHVVRDEREMGRIRRYIENNPVKAGVVGKAEDFAWSSAGEERRLQKIRQDTRAGAKIIG